MGREIPYNGMKFWLTLEVVPLEKFTKGTHFALFLFVHELCGSTNHVRA